MFGRWRKKRDDKERAKEDKEREKDKKRLEEIRNAVEPKDAPPAVSPPVPEDQTQESAGMQTLQEFTELTGRKKIPVELTRIVERTNKRVTVMRGNVGIVLARGNDVGKILFFFLKKEAYFVDPKRIIKVTQTLKKGKAVTYKLVYDILFSEPLKTDGMIEWSDDLEMVLADSGLDQYVTIASFEGAFQLTQGVKQAMLIVAFLGILLGLAINGVEHIVPTVLIRWVP